MLLQQQEIPSVLEVCGEDPSFICREVLLRTESRRWAELADIVFAKPFTVLVILVVAFVVNRVAAKVISRFERTLAGDSPPSRRLKRRLRGTSLGQRLPGAVLDTGVYSPRAAARAQTLGVVLRSIVAFLVWTITAITILGELGINLGPLIASAGIAGVAIGFGAQSLVKDFLAGMFILVEDQYGVGDIIDVGELSGTQVAGTVEAVSLRTTRLRSVNGTVWHVPNGTILRVGNMSQQWARALLDISVAYGSDIDEASRIIKATADELWQAKDWKHQILEEPELWGIESLDADGIAIRLVVKTSPSQQFAVMRELRRRIKRSLDDAGIEIPFPQRTVWVRHEPGAEGVDPFGTPAPAAGPGGVAAPARDAASEPDAAGEPGGVDDHEVLKGKSAPEEA
ncbi:MAG: mechanosensitive ion channel family protein [Acidimicrobiia bacterium]